MKKVEVTYEVTRRVCDTFYVTDEEYEQIRGGELTSQIENDLEYMIDDGDGDRTVNWSAVDDKTGRVISDWV